MLHPTQTTTLLLLSPLLKPAPPRPRRLIVALVLCHHTPGPVLALLPTARPEPILGPARVPIIYPRQTPGVDAHVMPAGRGAVLARAVLLQAVAARLGGLRRRPSGAAGAVAAAGGERGGGGLRPLAMVAAERVRGGPGFGVLGLVVAGLEEAGGVGGGGGGRGRGG